MPREMAETIFLKFFFETPCHSQHPPPYTQNRTLPRSTPSSFGLSCLLLPFKKQWVEMKENVTFVLGPNFYLNLYMMFSLDDGAELKCLRAKSIFEPFLASAFELTFVSTNM